MDNVARRMLLPAVARAPLAAVVSGTVVPAMAVPATKTDRFTLAVLPDTQHHLNERGSDQEPVRATLRYLARTGVAFLAQLGDITEHGTETEMRAADRVYAPNLPYSVVAGNHDIDANTDDQRGDSLFLRTFGPHRFARVPTYRGSSPGGYNSCHVFTAGARDWLVLALDWRVSDTGLRWAHRVLDNHPHLPAILTTHDLAWADEAGHAELSDHGRRLWDGLIRGNDQIFLALGGHYRPPGRVTLRNDHGHDVHVHITNYQDHDYGGAGMVRLYGFDPARATIDVRTLSPWLLDRGPSKAPAELTSDVDRFTIDLDFRTRFAAPEPHRPRGTMAYWRFDAAGSPRSARTARRTPSSPRRHP